jgi:amidophosphoribosyltransferase
LCRACFDGNYPVALPEPTLLGKHLLEDLDPRAEHLTVAESVIRIAP